MSNEGGKGCKPRPFSVSQEEYDNRWDAIFNKDKKEEESIEVDSSEEDRTQD